MPMPVDLVSTEIEGVLEVYTRQFNDERGFFSEAYSKRMWSEAGFTETFVQDCLSKSAKGVLRGMHYQLAPHGMGKLVRVITGAIFDVGIDLRRESRTFGKWVGRELTGENHMALYFPPSFAHGFVALADDTLVYYKCTSIHAPEAERAILYNDPDVAIDWPLEPAIISQKDKDAPRFKDAEYNF